MTVDLDTTIESAWRGFRRALADELDGLGEGDSLDIFLEPEEALDGAVPAVRMCRSGVSIVIDVPSNRIRAPHLRLRKAAQRRVRALGLTRRSRSDVTYQAAYPVSHVDQAASVAVSALRLAFGVVHPAFLVSDEFSWEGRPQPMAVRIADAEEEAAVTPVDRDDLNRLIDEALTPMIGHTPVRDADGDVPFRSGSAVVFVRTLQRSPIVRVFAEMVVAIRDVDAAVREVGELNREIAGVKFALHDDRILASVDMLALPFVAEHLRALVSHMCEVVSSNDDLASRRVIGRTFLAPEEPAADDDDEQEGDAEIHPAMLRLLQLDADRPGSLRPRDVAKVCDYDSDLLVELIHWNEGQEVAWRQARDEAKAAHEYDEAEASEGERAHAERTVKILRKALRLVLL